MNLQAILELGFGTALLLFVWPRLRRIIQNGMPLKGNVALPDVIPPRGKACLLALGIAVGLVIIAALIWFRAVKLAAFPLWLFWGIGSGVIASSLGVLLALALELVELRPLAPEHPWRRPVDDLQIRAGGKLLPVYYRETPELAPYLTARGIIVPCAALQNMTSEQLQRNVAGLLFDYRQGNVKKAWRFWGIGAFLMLGACIAGSVIGEPAEQLIYALMTMVGTGLSYLPFSVAHADGLARNEFIQSLVGTGVLTTPRQTVQVGSEIKAQVLSAGGNHQP